MGSILDFIGNIFATVITGFVWIFLFLIIESIVVNYKSPKR